ncbi:MAG: glycine cleavage T C-terminal barrel domain-containing protein, partial [Desulfobacterales bacterium]|nr:glycine cleavage T C-terminal barrel domain-containing protein [Desulfobacterales bacterium]
PDFIGKEALEKIQKRGLASRLEALTMDAGGNLYGGESVYADGKVVDRIRSANYGYTIGQDIGLVYLPSELAQPGTELAVQVMGERVTATVADLPLVDPKGEKIRA